VVKPRDSFDTKARYKKQALRNFNTSKAHLQMNSTRSKGILLLYEFFHSKFRKNGKIRKKWWLLTFQVEDKIIESQF